MPLSRPCLYRAPGDTATCGALSPGSYCLDHRPTVERARHNPEYDTPRWRRLRAKVVGAHKATNGYLCPGYQREPHLAAVLSADHIVAVANGGAMYDEANVQALCLSCNDRKGTR